MGAMRALGVPGQQRRVKLVGFDASFSLREGLRDDVVDALVVQDPFYIGYAGVKTIVQKLNGVEPPKRIDSPARLVTAAHLDDADIVKLLDPPSTPR
jgi:ribose transport system substrate-binding protein